MFDKLGTYVKMAKWLITKKEGTMLKVGDKAPDFAVSDQSGKTQKLSDYEGRRVVLWFYPKADTPG